MKKLIIVLATRNAGKSREIRAVFEGLPVEFKDLNEFGPIPDPKEDGSTFEENAYKKASFTARVLGLPTLADDSGLEVEALDGKPGVHSARYSGEGSSDAANNEKLLNALRGTKERKARFCCVLSLAVQSGAALTYEAVCEGEITEAPRGENGFGYDPLFFFPPLQKTFGEMSLSEKEEISHRGKALRELRSEFEKIVTWLKKRSQEEQIRRGDADICLDPH